MAASLFPDPLQMWRDAVTKLESEVNSTLTGSSKSRELVQTLHQFSNVSQGVQQLVEKVVDGYLRRANLPSRKEVAELAQSLRRIEDKLDRLLPAEALGAPGAPRPARTRRPPSAAPAAALVPAPAAAPQERPAKRRRAARTKES